MNINRKLQPLTGNTGKMEEFLFGSSSGSGQTTEIDASKEKKGFSMGMSGMSFKNEMGNMGMSLKKKLAIGTTDEKDEVAGDDVSAAKSSSSRNPMSLMSAAISGSKKKTNQSEAEILSSKISQVMVIMEDFRLQCPQTHSGLVLAFSGNTLSPITAADLKFKWHRIDPGNGQFIQIDESSRAWYPPTADDIGRKICLQCEDNLEQGFCRYIEAGPVEADPLLVTMMDIALSQSKFEVRDVTISLTISCSAMQQVSKEVAASEVPILVGISAGLSTTGTSDATTKSATSASTPPAKSPITKPTIPSILQFTSKVRVDVTTSGILIGDTFGMGGEPGSTGLRIQAAQTLQSNCQLPSSVLIIVPLPGSRANGHCANEPIREKGEMDASSSGTTADPFGSVWQWIGDCKGDMFEKLSAFLLGVPAEAEELRVTVCCSDRMHRDALALSVRTLAAFPADTEPRRRLEELPWLGGEATVARGVSAGGQDVCSRLKAVEEENAALRKKRTELTLQLLENGAGTEGKEGVDQGDATASEGAGSAQRELQAAIDLHKTRELDLERSNLELTARIKRLTHDAESASSQISDLKQRLADLTHEHSQAAQNLDVERRTSEALRLELARLVEGRDLAAREASMQQDRAVRDLKSALSAAESELRAVSEQRGALEAELRDGADYASKAETALAESLARCAVLEAALQEEVGRREKLLADAAKFEEERRRAEAEMVSPAALAEVEAKAAALLGERNHWQRKAESLSKDLRRVMHEAADRERDLEGQLERRHTDIETLKTQIAAYRDREVEAEPAKDPPPVRRRSISFNLGLRKGSKTAKDATATEKPTGSGAAR